MVHTFWQAYVEIHNQGYGFNNYVKALYGRFISDVKVLMIRILYAQAKNYP